ncbi:MAG: glycoside hydrolase family 2 protein, partial [Clostridia bacterium]|nr:glycoside hydrolase family 2 protein [Clostridia bacterium]
PAGYGGQPLYTVEVTLSGEGGVLDTWKKRIGLRTMTVRREKDEWGESFCHCVNGQDIFAMGADYIPEDNLLPRVNPERTRRLLEDARAANMNTVRVWGGGYYPDDSFYDICDELGLLVWQDFMFACASYDLTEAFEENICAEFRDNIRRLRHHASLALWCGNNEIESFVPLGIWAKEKRLIADYIKLYEYILPKIVKEEDPGAFYWPSSPSSGGSFDEPWDENRGDCHYWDVWHGLKPFTDYRNHFFRYASEFGFQSFPCMATIESFTRPEDRNVFSYIMEKHQRNASANGKIAEYLSQIYLYPSSFDAFVYASQLLQAQAMQYGVEHWRRHRGRCMGTLVWQLNDCWPVTSWASIDYFGRWKALHYYEKRFFAPVLISCEEEGTLNRNSVNAEPAPLKKSARLNVSNETATEFRGLASWSLRAPDASVLQEGAFPVTVSPYSAAWTEELDFSGEDTYGCYFAYSLEDEKGVRAGGGTVLFCAPKHFRFADPKLEARREGDEIIITAQAYARSVEIRCNPDAVLEDNFFDMNAGTRRIRVLRGRVDQVSARSVYDIR